MDEARVVEGSRYRMAKQVVATDELIGRTKEVVRDRLGEPIETNDDTLFLDNLGPNHSIGPVPAMDSNWLSVIFGQKNRVVRRKIWED